MTWNTASLQSIWNSMGMNCMTSLIGIFLDGDSYPLWWCLVTTAKIFWGCIPSLPCPYKMLGFTNKCLFWSENLLWDWLVLASVQLILLYMWEWVRVHFWLSYFMCNGWSEIYTSFVAVHGASNGWIPPLIHCIWLCLILIEWNVLLDCDFIKHIFEPFYEYHSEIEEYMDYYIEN